jgi:hypothetical protein
MGTKAEGIGPELKGGHEGPAQSPAIIPAWFSFWGPRHVDAAPTSLQLIQFGLKLLTPSS